MIRHTVCSILFDYLESIGLKSSVIKVAVIALACVTSIVVARLLSAQRFQLFFDIQERALKVVVFVQRTIV